MSHKTATVAHTIGIDTGKNTLHLIGLDDKGAIVLRETGSPMCRGASTNAPCKGRIQMRKTNPLHGFFCRSSRSVDFSAFARCVNR